MTHSETAPRSREPPLPSPIHHSRKKPLLPWTAEKRRVCDDIEHPPYATRDKIATTILSPRLIRAEWAGPPALFSRLAHERRLSRAGAAEGVRVVWGGGVRWMIIGRDLTDLAGLRFVSRQGLVWGLMRRRRVGGSGGGSGVGYLCLCVVFLRRWGVEVFGRGGGVGGREERERDKRLEDAGVMTSPACYRD